MLSHDEITRLYGPWKHNTPADAALLLMDYPGQWWIAGGWAIEAFTGISRVHDDLDIGIPRTDVPLLCSFLHQKMDVWAATGSLTPMTEVGPELPEDCDNLWLRPSGAEPWEYDVLLDDADTVTWTCKRDPSITRPLADVLWQQDGVTFLRPEVQLLLKAKRARPKDTLDFEACLPALDGESMSWLADALRQVHPDHPWLHKL
ncbi:MAG: hypothetical protein M9953_05315 [Thermomicrobiales bacterium]|nr:hypothetical protein [Thermomicrobiales bacterium]MCO5229227.1 hypothetical protein [Thermomicrobiales bacterium]